MNNVPTPNRAQAPEPTAYDTTLTKGHECATVLRLDLVNVHYLREGALTKEKCGQIAILDEQNPIEEYADGIELKKNAWPISLPFRR